jgi:hypothetical protein
LADFYDAVTVFERDALPNAQEPRKGVPQGRHAHGLLARGREVLDELFPKLSEEAVSQGAIYGDIVDEVLWFNYGVYLRNTPSSLKGLLVSRPMLKSLYVAVCSNCPMSACMSRPKSWNPFAIGWKGV